MLFGLAWWNTAAAEPSELYQRLGLEKTATSAEIRRAYHAQARQTHPDKVEGDKAAAAEKFKRLAEAYEVLTDKKLRAEYDRTGRVPDDRAKAAANQQSTGEEEEFGYGGGRPAPSGRPDDRAASGSPAATSCWFRARSKGPALCFLNFFLTPS